MQSLTERISLEADEHVLSIVRKHWFILLRGAVVPVALFFVPLVSYLALRAHAEAAAFLALIPHTGATLLFAFSLWGLVTWTMLFLLWTDYYLDMWTITNRRIIAINQRSLFRRSIASFRYERLQDVHIEIDGFIATLFDFGDLHTQTAGHDLDFQIHGVPNPREVKASILRAADELLTERHRNIASARVAAHDTDGVS